MKILITGKHSYIGTSVKEWINKHHPDFKVETISLRNVDLDSLDFSSYDVLIHVAGIAHISSNKKLIPEYFKVNRDLAIDVAKKAKQEGVKQFIFTSTMAIYGNDLKIGDIRPVDVHTPSPTNAYGQSKLEADLAIQTLNDDHFKVVVLRIPMVYGEHAKGNFLRLYNLALKLPIFPKINNQRSVLHIDNLSELIRLFIINNLNGVFYPQDKEYFNTTHFISKVRLSKGKKTFFIPFVKYLIKFMTILIKPINKIYGNKYYDQNNSMIDAIDYQITNVDQLLIKLK
jgi:nucleoside-diphosphate-sugar epimerase